MHLTLQIYTSNGTIERMARLVDIHVSLKQYHQDVMDETMKKGIPMMRPLFLHYPDDTNTVDMQFQYMYGPGIVCMEILCMKMVVGLFLLFLDCINDFLLIVSIYQLSTLLTSLDFSPALDLRSAP